MGKRYVYELFINGVIVRRTEDEFRTGIITKIVEDLPKINPAADEFIIKVKRIQRIPKWA